MRVRIAAKTAPPSPKSTHYLSPGLIDSTTYTAADWTTDFWGRPMKNSVYGVAVAATLFLCGTFAPASADTVLYLNDVVFDDGGTATGSFIYLGTVPILGTDIKTSPDDQFGASYNPTTYRSLIEGSAFFSGFQFDISANTSDGRISNLSLLVFQDFSLSSPNPLMTSPLPDWPYQSLEENSSSTGGDNHIRYIVSGFLSTEPPVAAVPEPSTWGMLLIGFAGIGAMLYRRRSLPRYQIKRLTQRDRCYTAAVLGG
jgi:hypothetical protein